MEVQEAIRRYLRHHQARGSSPKTLRWHRYSLARLDGGADVADLRADDLRATLAGMREAGAAQHSVADAARSAKAFGKWLVAEEYLPRDPFARVSQPRPDEENPPTLAPQEVQRLLDSCRRGRTGARDAAVIMLLYSTGLRAAEVCALRLADADWDQGLLAVRRGKGGRGRVVPLVGRPARALRRYLAARRAQPGVEALFTTQSGEPLTYATLHQALYLRGKRCGLAAHPHKLRHSCAVQYLRNGGKLESLRLLLGHSRFDQTLHYARLAGVDLVAAHDHADPARLLKLRA